MIYRKRKPLHSSVSYLLTFVAGIGFGWWLQRRQQPQRDTIAVNKTRAKLVFPNAMDNLKHSQAIKDYICQDVEWHLSDVALLSGDQQLSEATEGIVKSAGTNLLAAINGSVNAEMLDRAAQKWIPGQIILDDVQPKVIANMAGQILLKADFPPNASDFELVSGTAIPLTSCSLESVPSPDSSKMLFGYLSGLPPAFKARRISGIHAGIDLFIWATGNKEDYCHAVLDANCSASPAQVAEGIEFALSLFLGTRVHWRTLTTVDDALESTRFSLADVEHGLPFPPPIENTSDLDDTELATIVHTFLQYHLQKGYSAANYFMHPCWELSPSTQLTARALIVAVAIEGISRSLLSSLKRDSDPVFEEIYKQIEEITDSWIASAENQTERTSRKSIKGRIANLLGKRNELGGKALIKQAFAEVGCPISSDELEIWNTSRNATAHGAFERKSTTQQILDQYYTCVSLLYRLMLTNMEYHGKFIDYTRNSWPNATM